MSIGENWLAPQPTANIANAILTQALEPRLGCRPMSVVVAMTPTLARKPSNHHLTVVGLRLGSWIRMLTWPPWPH